MSSDADAAAAATVALFDGLYTDCYCDVAAGVLFIYDSFITSDREVACFWTTKHPGGASLLFFANKWISMALYVMVFFSFASFPSDKSCSLFSIAIQAMVILQFVPGAAFSALRAYVLSRSKLFGLLVFSLALAPVGANLVHYGYQFSGENFPPFGCLDTDNTTAALDLKLVVISRVPLIAADILLIYITWTRLSTGSWGALRNIRQSKRLSLSEVLSQGGAIYFIILFTLNVLHLIFSATAAATNDGNGSYVTLFTAPITAILISRFLLALQESNQMVVRLDPDDPLYCSRDQYDSTPSFISSLGGFINPDPLVVQSNDDSLELQVRSHSEAPEEEEDVGQTELPQAVASSSSTP